MTDRKRWLGDTTPSTESKRFRQEAGVPLTSLYGGLNVGQQRSSATLFYAPQSFSNAPEPSSLPTTGTLEGPSLAEATATSGGDWTSTSPSRSKRPRCPAESPWVEGDYPCKRYEVMISPTPPPASSATSASVNGVPAGFWKLPTPSAGQTLNGDVPAYLSNFPPPPSAETSVSAEPLATSLVLCRPQPHASSSALLPASVLCAIQAAYQGKPPDKVTFDVLHRMFQHFNESAITGAPNITIDQRDWEAILCHTSPTQADRVIEDLGEVEGPSQLETNKPLSFADVYPTTRKLSLNDESGSVYEVKDSEASAVVAPMDLD